MSVVETRTVLDEDLCEQAWKLYIQSFDELRYLAVQRHVLHGDEFDAVMGDPLVDKFLVRGEDGSLQGLSTMSTHLSSMPLISPDYFARRWPEKYDAGHIFCVGFVGVHPDSHGTGVFADLVMAMTKPIAEVQGVVVLDVCAFNKDRLKLPRSIFRIASTWAPVEMSELDTQTFVGYDFTPAG
jgi:hypothetical protein